MPALRVKWIWIGPKTEKMYNFGVNLTLSILDTCICGQYLVRTPLLITKRFNFYWQLASRFGSSAAFQSWIRSAVPTLEIADSPWQRRHKVAISVAGMSRHHWMTVALIVHPSCRYPLDLWRHWQISTDCNAVLTLRVVDCRTLLSEALFWAHAGPVGGETEPKLKFYFK